MKSSDTPTHLHLLEDITSRLRHRCAMLGQEYSITRPLVLEKPQHFANDAVEGVPGDGADRTGVGVQQRDHLAAEVVFGLQEACVGVKGVALLVQQLLVANEPRPLKFPIRGRHQGKRVGLVGHAQQRDSHFIGCSGSTILRSY